MKTVASAINFTIEFYESADTATEQWGRKKFDGTYTGLIGEIVSVINKKKCAMDNDEF